MILQIVVLAGIIAVLEAAPAVGPAALSPEPYAFRYDVRGGQYGQQFNQKLGSSGSGIRGSYGFTGAGGGQGTANSYTGGAGYRGQGGTRRQKGKVNPDPAADPATSDPLYGLGAQGYPTILDLEPFELVGPVGPLGLGGVFPGYDGYGNGL